MSVKQVQQLVVTCAAMDEAPSSWLALPSDMSESSKPSISPIASLPATEHAKT